MKILQLLSVVFLQIFSAAESKSEPHIAVVGAGAAGVAAATRLLEHGFQNVLVLEAENRVGGRVHSVFFGEAFVDLGAEWVHGENLVYDMVKRYNVLGHTETPKSFHHSSLKNIDQTLAEELVTLMESIYVPDGQRDFEEGATVGYYCIEKFNSTIHQKYSNDSEKLELSKSSMDLFHHYVLSSEGAFSWFEPSAKSDYRDCEGDLNLHWNGLGYKTALELLIKKFPDPTKQLPFDQKVLLRKEVTKIRYSIDDSRILLQCADGSNFDVDHVIFTPSVGVLKAQHKLIFDPPLPLKKQEAIENIGFGGVMKIVMHFKDRFWENKENFTGFNFVWGEDDKQAVLQEFEGPKEDRSWLTEVFCVVPPERNPNVLIGWATGNLVPKIEKMSNETVARGVVFMLRKFLGHQYNITEPDSIIRTSWYSNPHFRGTYSYQTVESRRGARSAEVELSKPILNTQGRPILQFAGEATHPFYFSTVHGAIETGHREADRLINLYRNN